MDKLVYLQVPKIDNYTFDYVIKDMIEYSQNLIRDLETNRRRVDRGIGILMNQKSHNGIIVDKVDNRKDTSKKFAFDLLSCDTEILGPKNEKITDDFVDKVIESKLMTIFNVTMYEDTLDYDSEAELKMWLDESKKIIEDPYITSKDMKLKHLPTRSFYFECNGHLVELCKCKAAKIEQLKNNKAYRFKVIVESIKRIR